MEMAEESADLMPAPCQKGCFDVDVWLVELGLCGDMTTGSSRLCMHETWNLELGLDFFLVLSEFISCSESHSSKRKERETPPIS